MYVVSILRKITLYLMKKYFDIFADVEVQHNDLIDISPPYLILGNHASNLDPFLIAAYSQKEIKYVTSQEFFRKFSTRYLLKFADAIPKIKFMRTTSTIKKIIRKKKENKVIGVFPEGRRNWDGKTENIIFSTAKLIKLLKIPVIIASIKGAHLVQPRWATYTRKGKIIINFKKILDKKLISSMTVKEIYNHTKKHFTYDEYSYQQKVMNSYRGKRLAEKLELFLFICPHCHSLDSMKSRDNKFYCQNCNYSVIYNNNGFFESSNKLYFKNPKNWNHWQLEYYKKFLSQKLYNQDIIMKNSNLILYILNNGRLKKIDNGELIINKNGLCFKGNSGKNINFDLEKLIGANIHYNYILEFYENKNLYRIEFNKSISAYKWLKTIEFIKEKIKMRCANG